MFFATDLLGVELWSKQREILTSVRDNRQTAVRACHGPGKGLPLDTPLATPDGWTTMADVTVGDCLIGHDGRAVRVQAVHDPRLLDCYRVSFSDGTSIVCDADHLWGTLDFRARHRLRARRYAAGLGPIDWRDCWDDVGLRTPGEIRASLRHGGQLSHLIPATCPLDLPARPLPLDPYVFGLWLGDGTAVRAEITTADPELEALIAARGFAVKWRRQPHRCDSLVFADDDSGTALLRRVGVYGRKVIPPEYLRAGEDQRRDLLAGLLDSDGWAEDGASACIGLSDPDLADAVEELIVSLGYVCRRRVKATTHRPSHILRFRPDRQVFRLARKAALLNPGGAQSSRHTGRVVTAVDPVPTIPTRCLSVEGGFYLAGPQMIPTHNTFTAAVAVLWFLRLPGARVVTTAPTWTQVRALLWHEIRGLHSHAKVPLGGQLNQTELLLPDGRYAIGLSTKPEQVESFQGHHAPNILLVFDEASGVPQGIFDAGDGYMTTAGARKLLIGNPTRTSGEFFGAFHRNRAAYSTIHISAFDMPAFTGEKVSASLAERLTSREWVEERERKWKGSALWDVKVCGDFPRGADDAVIALADVEDAQARSGIPVDGAAEKVVACDVARFGDDETVIATRVGDTVRIARTYNGRDTMQTAGHIVDVKRMLGDDARVVVDDTGVGGGVTDRLRELGHGVTAFNGGERAFYPDDYPNRRSEAWFDFAEALPSLDLDDDEQLAADLTAPTWKMDSAGRRVVERKAETKKRLGRSPDRGDAVLLTLQTQPTEPEVIVDVF